MNISEVIVTLGNDDMTFGEPIISSINSILMTAFRAAVDFNNDSLLDIVLGDFYSGNVRVFLGNGDGTFHDIIFIVKDCRDVYVLSVGNLNSDRFLDFAILCSLSTYVHIVFGNANGTFAENASLNIYPDSDLILVQIADFNDDNFEDILVYDARNWGVNVFLGHGNGSFETQKISFLRTLLVPISLAIGDFNEDTIQDLIFTWTLDTDVGGISVAFGYNDGTFSVPTYFNLATYPLYASAVRNLNIDGHLDVLITSNNYEPYSLSIFFGDGNGNFEFYTIFSSETSSLVNSVIAVDLNIDGYRDILAASDFGLYIFLNTGQCNNASEIFEASTSIHH